ncbi:MAG TPA: ABC transporter substrate-binding protein [Candidatus Acidoferrum sp.]|nr:ABC transporter substrate-binding protein [Candidatus Acidoferrum sp.]
MTSRSVRLFVVALGLGAFFLPCVGEAQPAKVYRVGVLSQGSAPPSGGQNFTRALHDLGYIEGRNLTLDRRWAEGKHELSSSLAAELVALKPDVIVADGTPAAIAVMRATATIPIVMVNVSDPVGSGLVASLARPGGNVTGGAEFGTETRVKNVELLQAVVPKATRMAVLMSDNPAHSSQLKTIQETARSMGLTILPTLVRSADDFERAFASMTKNNAGGLIVLGGAPFVTPAQRDKLVALAAKARLPAIYWGRFWVDAGGLLSYGSTWSQRWGLSASYVDKILKGAKPAELPVQQPTEFELVINLKTAKALGLTIPQSLLIRADDLIQ